MKNNQDTLLNHQEALIQAGHFDSEEKLALSLGLRQTPQLHRLGSARARVVNQLLSLMSAKQKQAQLNFGTMLVTGFKPGIFDDNEFSSAAAQTRLSEKVVRAARQVLVEGDSVEVSAQKGGILSANLNQACISIVRKSGSMESALTNSAKWAVMRFKSLDTKIDPMLLLASLMGNSVNGIGQQVAGDKKVHYSQAALFNMLLVIDEVHLLDMANSLLAFFSTLGEMVKKTKSSFRTISQMMSNGDGFNISRFIIEPNEHTPPTLDEFKVAKNALDELNALSPIEIRELSLNIFKRRGVYDLEAVDTALIETGDLMVAVGKVYPEEPYVNVYKAYKAWKTFSINEWWLNTPHLKRAA